MRGERGERRERESCCFRPNNFICSLATKMFEQLEKQGMKGEEEEESSEIERSFNLAQTVDEVMTALTENIRLFDIPAPPPAFI